MSPKQGVSSHRHLREVPLNANPHGKPSGVALSCVLSKSQLTSWRKLLTKMMPMMVIKLLILEVMLVTVMMPMVPMVTRLMTMSTGMIITILLQ